MLETVQISDTDESVFEFLLTFQSIILVCYFRYYLPNTNRYFPVNINDFYVFDLKVAAQIVNAHNNSAVEGKC